MIGYLRGKVVWRASPLAIVETAGVGYLVRLSAEGERNLKVGNEIALWTHLAVRDDALNLYGFPNREELEWFQLLITLPGIGPKSASTILSVASPATLTKAVGAGDSDYLTKISGLGRKNAEKIVLGLKDKVAALPGGGTGDQQARDEEADMVEALHALGYSLAAAREALKQVPAGGDAGARIKQALKHLR